MNSTFLTGSIQVVRSSLWEKATRQFDPGLPDLSSYKRRPKSKEVHETVIPFLDRNCLLVVVAQR